MAANCTREVSIELSFFKGLVSAPRKQVNWTGHSDGVCTTVITELSIPGVPWHPVSMEVDEWQEKPSRVSKVSSRGEAQHGS